MQKSMINILSSADLVSIVNAIFGFFAIVFLISDFVGPFDLRLRISFSFILLALLADGLDGIVARKFKKSEIGEHLDSMADMVSMCIATSIFIYISYIDTISGSIYRQVYLIFALSLFLSFGIIRLASFYIMKNKSYYVGLPAPASAIILLLLGFFKVDFIFILPSVILIGAFMASNIVFPKMNLKIQATAFVLILLTLIVYDSFYKIIPLFLLIAIVIYATGGPIYTKFLAKNR